MKSGDKVIIKQSSNHPCAGEYGTLLDTMKVPFGDNGWSVKIDHNIECFAKEQDLIRL
jgi:hypothetical protein